MKPKKSISLKEKEIKGTSDVGLNHKDEVKSPRDLASGLSSGERMHAPKIIKNQTSKKSK